MSTSVAILNTLPPAEFVAQVGPLFEHSPWIAERTAKVRPFANAEALMAALNAAVSTATLAEQVALIQAHPDLAGKLAVAGELTEHSTAEQRSVRLDQLSPAEFGQITALNMRYREKFGFPFVICVKDHTLESIFTAFALRVDNSRDIEIPQALHEIGRIGWHRLRLLLGRA